MSMREHHQGGRPLRARGLGARGQAAARTEPLSWLRRIEVSMIVVALAAKEQSTLALLRASLRLRAFLAKQRLDALSA